MSHGRPHLYLQELKDLRAELLDKIDGADESRGRDTRLTDYIDALDWAISTLRKPRAA